MLQEAREYLDTMAPWDVDLEPFEGLEVTLQCGAPNCGFNVATIGEAQQVPLERPGRESRHVWTVGVLTASRKAGRPRRGALDRAVSTIAGPVMSDAPSSPRLEWRFRFACPKRSCRFERVVRMEALVRAFAVAAAAPRRVIVLGVDV